MESNKHFCTCPDLDCPLHPGNHEEGCDPCIQKNLAAGEIPSCFFAAVHEDLTENEDFTMGGFAAYYNKHRG
jgi:hypothetical protein